MSPLSIPFNKPFTTGHELEYIQQAIANLQLAGNGEYTQKCHQWLETIIGCKNALLTHSCTAALEMAAILADIQPGDEVIMPSYTFVSTANAFVLRGAIPVFVDIRPDTLNLDEAKLEAAITPRTKAIVPVHYAGVGCEMDQILSIANHHSLLVIEDAAQGILSTYQDRPLGSMGHMAAVSFHETKNIISGEGGALLINDPKWSDRAEIIWEKGTNRNKFYRGEIDKYQWVDIGSSYLPGELTAAFLWAQIEQAKSITQNRLMLWNKYHGALADLELTGKLRRPIVPDHCQHNAHLYYILLPTLKQRNNLIKRLKELEIGVVFHYVPLHTSPGGKKYGRVHGSLDYTQDLSDRLARLPLWIGLENHLDYIVESISKETAA